MNLTVNSTVEVDGEETAVSGGVTMRERLSSPALWAAVLGLAGLILEALGVFRKLGITDETWNAIITAAGAVLSAFGIVNNPTDRKSF